MPRIPVETAESLVGEAFIAAGCSAAEGARIAASLVSANLAGHDSHGIVRMPRYLDMLRDGRVVAGREVELVSDTGAMAVLDGRQGFGQTIGPQAVRCGIGKARAGGVGVVALRNCGHLGRIGEWGAMAAREGLVSVHFVNARGSILVAPYGARERRFSTAPFCVAVPRKGREPLVLDFATSVVAEGKAMVALHGGKPLPGDALIDAHGNDTSDPRPLYGETAPGRTPDPNAGSGALNAFGLHKGSGLNFFMELFGGALTGSGTAAASGEAARRRFCNGMLSIYMRVGTFHRDDWFAREVSSYVEYWKAARPSRPGGEVLIPGEKERRTMAERRESGLPLPERAWADILAAAEQAGMSDADVETALG